MPHSLQDSIPDEDKRHFTINSPSYSAPPYWHDHRIYQSSHHSPILDLELCEPRLPTIPPHLPSATTLQPNLISAWPLQSPISPDLPMPQKPPMATTGPSRRSHIPSMEARNQSFTARPTARLLLARPGKAARRRSRILAMSSFMSRKDGATSRSTGGTASDSMRVIVFTSPKGRLQISFSALNFGTLPSLSTARRLLSSRSG